VHVFAEIDCTLVVTQPDWPRVEIELVRTRKVRGIIMKIIWRRKIKRRENQKKKMEGKKKDSKKVE
jgi:hypothetical protein